MIVITKPGSLMAVCFEEADAHRIMRGIKLESTLPNGEPSDGIALIPLDAELVIRVREPKMLDTVAEPDGARLTLLALQSIAKAQLDTAATLAKMQKASARHETPKRR